MNDWKELFDERQRKEIEFNIGYAERFAHGTVGHNIRMLVAQMAGALDRIWDGETEQFRVLNVPYHSQHEADAQRFSKDCGPTAVEMVGKFYQPSAEVATDQIMQHITQGADRSTYIRELQAASEHFFNVKLDRYDEVHYDALKGWVSASRYPCIVLVHYGSFQTRMDRAYTAGHYLVVVGFNEVLYQGKVIERVIVHDPDYYRDECIAQGAFLPVVKSHFYKMWDDAPKDRGNPQRMALVARPVE